jgi:hypothetical protein
MDRLAAERMFVKVVETGGFATAAARLGTSSWQDFIKPGVQHPSRRAGITCAVSAAMREVFDAPAVRRRLIASGPSISGMLRSIRIRLYRVRIAKATASTPFASLSVRQPGTLTISAAAVPKPGC